MSFKIQMRTGWSQLNILPLVSIVRRFEKISKKKKLNFKMPIYVEQIVVSETYTNIYYVVYNI